MLFIPLPVHTVPSSPSTCFSSNDLRAFPWKSHETVPKQPNHGEDFYTPQPFSDHGIARNLLRLFIQKYSFVTGYYTG